ncbi:MAG: SUMF1/EgtB/PvdO family nonheme iron enzyme [Treponema sp.]|nr:SUMF1/EgtB/PvdO family nonheme iron enzyme [Treponema sp.]
MKIRKYFFLCVLILLIPSFAFSQQTQEINEALGNTALYLSGRIKQHKVTVVAVLNFTSTWPRLSEYVVEELSGSLVEIEQFTVVSRGELELLQQEMHFQLSGEVSDISAQSIGQRVGAQAIVTGEITDTGSSIRLRTRLISVETAQILGMQNVNLRQDNRLSALTSVVAPIQSMPAVRAAPNPNPAARNAVDAEGGIAAPASAPASAPAAKPAAAQPARAAAVARPSITTPPARKKHVPGPAQDGFLLIEAGSFIMGSPLGEPKRKNVEVEHQVKISPFYLGIKEVTQLEYQSVMGRNPSRFKGSQLPVERVSWFDALDYCNRMSIRDGFKPVYIIEGSGRKRTVRWNLDADGYRLPTEAEWEYACRAGSITPFNTTFGQGYNITTDLANFNGKKVYSSNPIGIFRKKTTDVGRFDPNPWGLYDMHGNVLEWCWDIFGRYSKDPQTHPIGAVKGSRRVQRGGSWKQAAQFIRSAQRFQANPNSKKPDIGFRIAQSVIQPIPDNLVQVNGGTFTMGSNAVEPMRSADETRHQVTLTSFYMAKYPVTITNFWYFANETEYLTEAEITKTGNIYNNKNWEKKEDASWKYSYMNQVNSHPVVMVNWNDAFRYCNWLSEQEGLVPAYSMSGKNVTMNMNVNGYRLPTEAEWEYACRAGTTTPFSTGDNITTAEANYNGNFPYTPVNTKGTNRERTTPVGSFKPNEWGLYDMHGNVFEMCWDIYGNYSNELETNPTGPSSGSRRVIRGGSWVSEGKELRSAARSNAGSSFSSNAMGFRIVRSIME